MPLTGRPGPTHCRRSAHIARARSDLVRPLLDVSAADTPPSTRAAEHAAQHLRSQGFHAPPWDAPGKG